MSVKQLQERVCDANLELKRSGLVIYSFGNVSGVDREQGLMVIKPSGVSYDALEPDLMVVVRLEDGIIVTPKGRPSVDTETHRELYNRFVNCGGIVHTHSEYATACAQAGEGLVCRGTTHADVFYGDIPVTRQLTPKETEVDYELNTGRVIAETFAVLDPRAIPGVLVAGHGPFAWGNSPGDAVHSAVMLEYIARMEIHARALQSPLPTLGRHLLDKHYLRKHGNAAYYGQATGPG